MAYISNTQQKKPVFGLQLNNTQIPLPNMKTANSTPQMRTGNPIQDIVNKATNGIPGGQSMIPTPKGTSGVLTPPVASYGGSPSYGGGTQNATGVAPSANPASTLAPTTAPSKGLLTPPPAAKPSPFGGFIQGLQDSSKQSKDQKRFLEKLDKEATRNREIAEDARRTSEMYGSEIARIGKIGSGAVAGAMSTGTDVVGRGNANLAAESVSNRISALGAGLNAELQGTQQQLTGAEQGITGFTNALSGANTQQQLSQQALSTGASYTQPSPAGYGQTVFDPATGTFTGGGSNLDPSVAAQQLAQQVKSGAMTYEQAVASLGYAGGAGQQFLNQALGSNFNPSLSSANIAGQAEVFQQLPTMRAADTAAEGIKQKINTYLGSNPQLNASDLAVGNKLQQWIEGKQLTDPKYQTLFNYLNEYTNTLAPILGVGGNVTNLKTEIAQSFVNAAASGQSINEVLENLQSLSRGKISDLASGAMGGGVNSSSQSVGTGGGGMWDW